MAAPAMDRDAPVSATQITLGRRTERMMELARIGGMGFFTIAAQITVRVSFTGTRTLPTQTHSTSVANMTAVKSR